MELGNIDYCEHPKRIINPYTHERVWVACRRCKCCLNKKTSAWSGRVANECKLHAYSAFVTLTYDNEHLPLYQPECMNERGEMVWTSNRFCDEKVIVGNYDFIKVSNSDVQAVAYCCKSDIVKFFKRLRSKLSYYFKKHHIITNEKIRYFVCSEYGPKTLRPHYHAIIWFDSEEVARVIEKMLSSSWSNGFTDFEYVNSTAPQYVAKYVSGNFVLPEILQHDACRTFHLQSQAPSVGYRSDDYEKFEKEVIDGCYGHFEYDSSSQSSVFVQPPGTLETRCFPKCREYRSLSRIEKLRIYAYKRDICSIYGIDTPILDDIRSHFESVVDYHCTNACYLFCVRYNCTPEMYLDYLDRYYYMKDMYLLKLQYEYQKKYIEVLKEKPSDLLDFYPTLFEDLPYRYFGSYSNNHFIDVLRSFGVPDVFIENELYPKGRGYVLNGEVLDKLHQRHSKFYVTNIEKEYKIHNDSLKVKVKNEVLNPLINITL